MSSFNVEKLGQVFTPESIAREMLKLRQNQGRVLEPSAGQGIFLSLLEKEALGLEIDRDVFEKTSQSLKRKIRLCDFFEYSTKNKFQSIIGNPPYVRYQDILPQTKKHLPMNWFDKRSNLYLFFIAKSMDHLERGGELIFITPRDFLKSSNAKKLNEELYKQGSFTDFYELGDKKVFEGYSPNCAIWRWEKGRRGKKMSSGKTFCYFEGQIWFGEDSQKPALSQYFDVKVGAVSGADSIFENQKYSNVKMVCSRTRTTGEKRSMIYNKKCAYLEPFKKELLKRKVKNFNQSNWWQWGRNYYEKEGERIYVNCKTRNQKPFFVSDSPAYDGSVLALFPKDKSLNLSRQAEKLNQMDWESLGFVCDGRLLFSQKSLQNAPVGEL